VWQHDGADVGETLAPVVVLQALTEHEFVNRAGARLRLWSSSSQLLFPPERFLLRGLAEPAL
jgi:hypothetical protein